MGRRVRAHLRSNVVGYLALFVALGSGGAYAASVIGGDGRINGCYRASGAGKGDLRVLESGAKCRSGEKKISWAHRGAEAYFGASKANEFGAKGEQPCTYVGQIVLTATPFALPSTMPAHGQTLPIEEWEALYDLIGTTYGGDGQQTFRLPDLRGAEPKGRTKEPLTYVMCVYGVIPPAP